MNAIDCTSAKYSFCNINSTNFPMLGVVKVGIFQKLPELDPSWWCDSHRNLLLR